MMKMFCACFRCLTSFAPISSYHSCLEISLRFEWCCSPYEWFSWSPLQKHFSITQRIRRYICRSMNGGFFFMVGKYTHFSMDPSWAMGRVMIAQKNKTRRKSTDLFLAPPSPKTPHPKKPGFSYIFCVASLVGETSPRSGSITCTRSWPTSVPPGRVRSSAWRKQRKRRPWHRRPALWGIKVCVRKTQWPTKRETEGEPWGFFGFFCWLGYYKGWHFLPNYIGIMIIVNHH